MKDKPEAVLVGLSGGVDSAVAALLLQEEGYRVIGITLSMWNMAGDGNRQSKDIYLHVRRLADALKIDWKLIDQHDNFKQKVVDYYLDGLKTGLTPNPCIVCNKMVKWGAMLDAVDQYGAGYLATGHYARRHITNTIQLLKAKDKRKDQSYFLSILGQKELSKTLFPLGNYTKEMVRKIGRMHHLPVIDRPESQDLCFLGGMKQVDFLNKFAPELLREGEIMHVNGKTLGMHQGLANFTIGQRKGIKVPYPEALYVIEKNVQKNRLIIGEEKYLGRSALFARDINWISGSPPASDFRGNMKIRYQSKEIEGLIHLTSDGRLEVQLDHAVRGITPGQALVMYQEDACLGMGYIE